MRGPRRSRYPKWVYWIAGGFFVFLRNFFSNVQLGCTFEFYHNASKGKEVQNMRSANDRRQMILEALSDRRYETVANLASEFNVSIIKIVPAQQYIIPAGNEPFINSQAYLPIFLNVSFITFPFIFVLLRIFLPFYHSSSYTNSARWVTAHKIS